MLELQKTAAVKLDALIKMHYALGCAKLGNRINAVVKLIKQNEIIKVAFDSQIRCKKKKGCCHIHK